MSAAVLLALHLLALDATAVRVIVVDRPPVSMTWAHQQEVQAWVNGDGTQVVFIAGWSTWYRKAVNGNHDAILYLAAAIAHERCHLAQAVGHLSEGPCYDVQVQTLRALGARNYVIQRVETTRHIFK